MHAQEKSEVKDLWVDAGSRVGGEEKWGDMGRYGEMQGCRWRTCMYARRRRELMSASRLHMQMSHLRPVALSLSATIGTRALGRAWTDSNSPDSSITSASFSTISLCSSFGISPLPSYMRVRSRSAPARHEHTEHTEHTATVR